MERFGKKGNVNEQDVIELLRRQRFSCYICEEQILSVNWLPYCCYQFSIDRLDNTKPHDRENVLISCYYCNCRYHPEFKQVDKCCTARCHKVAKPFLRTRSQVETSTIQKFHL